MVVKDSRPGLHEQIIRMLRIMADVNSNISKRKVHAFVWTHDRKIYMMPVVDFHGRFWEKYGFVSTRMGLVENKQNVSDSLTYRKRAYHNISMVYKLTYIWETGERNNFGFIPLVLVDDGRMSIISNHIENSVKLFGYFCLLISSSDDLLLFIESDIKRNITCHRVNTLAYQYLSVLSTYFNTASL